MRKNDHHIPLPEDGEHHAFKETYEENGKPVSKFIVGQMRQNEGKWSYQATDLHLNIDKYPQKLMPSFSKGTSGRERTRVMKQRGAVYYWAHDESQRWEAGKLSDPKELHYLGRVLKGMPKDEERERRRFYIGGMSKAVSTASLNLEANEGCLESRAKMDAREEVGDDPVAISQAFPDHMYKKVEHYSDWH